MTFQKRDWRDRGCKQLSEIDLSSISTSKVDLSCWNIQKKSPHLCKSWERTVSFTWIPEKCIEQKLPYRQWREKSACKHYWTQIQLNHLILMRRLQLYHVVMIRSLPPQARAWSWNKDLCVILALPKVQRHRADHLHTKEENKPRHTLHCSQRRRHS